MPSIIALLLAVYCVVLGNMRGLLYIPLSAIMLVPYLYNAGKFKVRMNCIQACVILTVACNIVISQYTAMHFYNNKPSREEIDDIYHGEEVVITSIGAIPIWLTYIPPIFIVVHLVFACGTLSMSYNAIDKL